MAFIERKFTVLSGNVGHTSTTITNLGMLALLEDIGGMHSDIAGFGINDIEKTNLFWVLLNWKVNILKRSKYGEILNFKTWAKDGGKFFTYRDFEVTDSSGEVVCKATSKWSLIGMDKKSIVRITDDVISKYEPETQNIFDTLEIEKLKEPENHSYEYHYKTQRRDIDVNNHMHNSNYLSLAYEALPDEVYYSDECNNFEITYKNGIKLNDTVKCLYEKVDGAHYVTIKSLDDKKLHAIVKLYN